MQTFYTLRIIMGIRLIYAFVWLQIITFCIGKPSPSETAAVSTNPTETEKFENVWQLDTKGNYWLYWNSNATHITFETHVKTTGYVGFGLSSNGKMFPTDVVVGWVDNGTPHFKDCHTTGHTAPVIDSSQDYSLILGKEENLWTVLKFVRKIDTCDDKDYFITDNTVKVIWSYHQRDPASFSDLVWHGADNRGAKSLLLLSAAPNEFVTPKDAEHFELRHDNFHVPAKDTTYQCKMFKVPPKPTKHHMIRFEPIITPGNENHVHHVVVYNCPTATEDDVGKVFECYVNRPKHLGTACYDIMFAWAVGGDAFDFPPEAGYPLNGAGEPQYLLMETHFDNPIMKSGIVDSSGFRLITTPTLRKHDAGSFEIGINNNNLQIIPPHEKAFLSTGYCRQQCIQRMLKNSTNSIKVFGIFLHAHLLGVQIKARHIRGDVELEPLAEDKNYDFDFQETRMLASEREIKYVSEGGIEGDSLLVQCTYDSTGRTKVTSGGLSTSEEMCFAWMYYYPKKPVSICISQPMYSELNPDPNLAARQLYSWDWNDKSVREKYTGILQNTSYFHYCQDNENPVNYTDYRLYYSRVGEPATKYSPPPRNCPVS